MEIGKKQFFERTIFIDRKKKQTNKQTKKNLKWVLERSKFITKSTS